MTDDWDGELTTMEGMDSFFRTAHGAALDHLEQLTELVGEGTQQEVPPPTPAPTERPTRAVTKKPVKVQAKVALPTTPSGTEGEPKPYQLTAEEVFRTQVRLAFRARGWHVIQPREEGEHLPHFIVYHPNGGGAMLVYLEMTWEAAEVRRKQVPKARVVTPHEFEMNVRGEVEFHKWLRSMGRG